MIRKLFLSILSAFAVFYTANAQELTPNDSVKHWAAEAVEEFIHHVSCVANNELTAQQRQNEMKAALALFIGDGEQFSVVNEIGNMENYAPVRIGFSNTSSGRVRWMPIKKYLLDLYNDVRKYDRIVIQSVGVAFIDNIVKVGSHYEATVCYQMNFIGYRDGKKVYSDGTKKKMKILINLPDGEEIFPVKLGNIITIM